MEAPNPEWLFVQLAADVLPVSKFRTLHLEEFPFHVIPFERGASGGQSSAQALEGLLGRSGGQEFLESLLEDLLQGLVMDTQFRNQGSVPLPLVLLQLLVTQFHLHSLPLSLSLSFLFCLTRTDTYTHAKRGLFLSLTLPLSASATHAHTHTHMQSMASFFLFLCVFLSLCFLPSSPSESAFSLCA